MNRPLENKRALVTGGSLGIGAAIVRRLAGEGAQVAFTYLSHPDQASGTERTARAFGVRALAIQADNPDATALVGAVQRAIVRDEYLIAPSLPTPPGEGT